ncbi:right-handed parallel beta-helix repeat-containing protein [Haloterrigena alkaliphila]|uniref:right-handed parallel beta-helix repeat-containing protein n=1 Tax=Haloterrigena alkaliphila TaxID=2816475 RepID=UPI001CFFD933|nr:right-handed parallel beta-helix repeat-containing protein [Haloterrigena alkaliphila]UHQ95326.1 right-handed parallel beta-helix repeat-containing protein [Haloterrigena alkaliphila]
MAREHPVRGPDSPEQAIDSDDKQQVENHSDRGTIDRRSYMKLVGATAATAGLGASAASAASSDYDVIEASGQVIRIDSGETWENKLIDFGNGGTITIAATGTNWTIRNIGFTGYVGSEGTAPRSGNIFGLADTSGGTSVVENVFFGEGWSGRPADHRPHHVYVTPSHSGEIHFNNVNFSQDGCNGVYGYQSGTSGSGGTLHFDGCYAYDNHHTAWRPADNGSSIRNSVIYKSGSRSANRGIWVWEGYGGGTELENVHIITNGVGSGVVTRGDPDLSMTNVYTDDGSGTHGNPEHFVPDGCPTSPEEAASGSANVPAQDLPENTLTITGAGDPTRYYAETSGEIVQNPDRGDIQSHDQIGDTSAEGWVTTTNHVDSFRFDGELVDVGFHQGSATVELNGEEIDPSTFGEQPLDRTLLVDGIGTSGGTRYEFTVSGAAEKSTYQGASVDDEDTIASGSVTGSVAGWRDAFNFNGELEELTVDGDARVYVDDEQVDPADFGDEQPHVLTLVGNGSDASYEISVDGTIDTVAGDDSEQFATARSESTVEGSIQTGVQRFRFSGVVSDVTFLDGSAHVYVDDERIDPDEFGEQELLPHAIVVDGTGTDGQTEYTFTIDGEVITSSYRDATIDPDDSIEGTAVSGTVDDEIDAYWFDGDIVDFRLKGDANIDVDYNARND